MPNAVLGYPDAPRAPGGRLNIKMPSYEYMDPRVIYNTGIAIPGKTVYIVRRGPGCSARYAFRFILYLKFIGMGFGEFFS